MSIFLKRILFFLPLALLVFFAQSPAFVQATPPVLSNTTYLTSGTTWTVPPDWNNSNNTIEVIGGGGGGSREGSSNTGGHGGGGGGYSQISNLTLTPGNSVTYQVGGGGAGGASNGSNGSSGTDTWFNGASCAAASVCGKAGGGGNLNNSGGAGGALASGVGTIKNSGGAGGGAAGGNGADGGSGGGGSAGPLGGGGAGANGDTSNSGGSGGGGNGGGLPGNSSGGGSPGSGGNNHSGVGGGPGGGSSGTQGGGGGGSYVGVTTPNGGAGGPGVEWGSAGSGGGGGGGAGNVGNFNGGVGGAGGLYGGGGASGGYGSSATGNGGVGAKGIVVVTNNASLTIYTTSSTGGPLYAGNSVTYTFTRNGPSTYAAVPVGVTLGGTAISGTDYSITNVSGGVVTIPANTYSIAVTVTALGSMTAAKTFSLTVPNSASYNVASPGSYSINMAPAVSSQSLTATFSGNQVNVAWSSQYTYSCTVTGSNSFSASGTSGSQMTTPGVSPATYTLSCNTPTGTQTTSVISLSGSSLTALKNGLLDFWSFNSGDITGGTTANDVSPNACSPGTLQNAPTATTGHYGDANNALAFNGSNQYISAQPIGVTTTISVSAWIYSSNLSQQGMIVEKDPVNTEWELFFDNSNSNEGAKGLKWRGGSNTGIVAPAPSNNAWHYIVATQSGTTAKIYIDGALVTTGTAAALGTGTDVNNNIINIGDYTSTNYNFSGSIDEVMIYNRVLAASEVSQLYTLSAVDAASLHSAPPVQPYSVPIVESVPGYSSISAINAPSYGLPIYSNNLSNQWSGNHDGGVASKPQPLQAAGTPADVSSGWYSGTPSPLTCYQNTQGVCMWLGGTEGIRVASITGTTINVSSGASLLGGLIGWWTLDTGDIVGTLAKDISGSVNNGTLQNTPTPVAGHWADGTNALTLDGSTEEIDTATAYVNPKTFSLSAWFKTSTASGNKIVGFERNKTGTGSNNSDRLLYMGTDGKIYFGWYDGSIRTVKSNAVLTNNNWHHAVATFDGTTGKLYIDGVLQASLSAGAAQNFTGYWRIGAYKANGYPNAADGYFNGSIDEVMIWNRALSASDVTSLYGLSASDAQSLRPNLIPPQTGGIDQVSSNPVNACGVPYTHWSYVKTAPILMVPKYSQINVEYMCQPTQEYLWAQYRDYGCWPGSCIASTISQRIFRFADRAKVNGVATMSLDTTNTQSISGVSNFTLQCGGYLPEEGTQLGLHPAWPAGTDGFGAGAIDDFNSGFVQAMDQLPQNTGLPPFYNMNRHSACWTYCYWPWTWAYYNVASSTFYQPSATLAVQACNDNEIVVNNACQACPGGTYRSGNSCIGNPPPTATIDAGSGHDPTTGNGNATTTIVGAPITISATYTAYPSSQSVNQTIILSSGTSWIVPADWNSSNNTIELWGGGGGGGGDNGGTVGANGKATTFDGASAGGGGGGQDDTPSTPGAGGVVSGGTSHIAGSSGSNGSATTGGKGGDAPGGGGTGGATITTGMQGNPGNGPGGGGSGGCSGCSTTGGGGGGSGGYVKFTNLALTPGNSLTYAIGTGGAGGGGASGGGDGASGRILVTYGVNTTDSLVATAINNDSTGNSVDCGLIQTFNGVSTSTYTTGSGCETNPDTNKTYTFTPTFADLGVDTFSAQIKTNFYNNYNSYAKVQVTVTCPAHSSGPSCTCDPHYSQQGSLCVLDECTNNAYFPGIQTSVPVACTQNPDFTCSPNAGYVLDGLGNCVPPGPPANLVLTVSPSRVRKGESTSLTWTGTNIPPACRLSSNPTLPGLPATTTSSLTGSTAPVLVGPINQTTLLTLSCTSSSGSGSAQKIIGTVPVYQEI